MQANILWILLESMQDRIGALIWWNEYVAILLHDLLTLWLLRNVHVISHIDVDLILITPLSAF